MNQLVLNDFKELFRGNENSYGQHIYGTFEEGKKEIGGKSWTVKDKILTDKEYEAHLCGHQGIGIIPINRENKCKFVVIDIDIYDKKTEQIVVDAIQKRDLPLSIFLSKSGGYHIYLFFTDFIVVKEARDMAESFIRLLSMDILCIEGRKALEIFPKQMVLSESDKGSWINLPYYNGNESSSRQVMLHDSRRLDLQEALVIIKNKKIMSLERMKDFLSNLHFNDAPPCLQSIYYLDFLDNNRNNYLFSFGVYFKKINEDNFESKLYELNRTLTNPLPDDELEATVISSIRKKGYGYNCKADPCVSYCNKTECKQRTYGIGEGKYITELDFGQLRQIETDPPYYEWEINKVFIRFKTEDDILNQNVFRKLCMRKIRYAPYKLKDGEWIKIVNNALSTMETSKMDVQEDISPGAMLKNYFCEFILDTPRALEKEHILRGRVYDDVRKRRFLFRPKDLLSFLYTNRQFRSFGQTEIHGWLKDIKAGYTKINTETNKQMRIYEISYEFFEANEEDLQIKTIEMSFKPEEIDELAENIIFPEY